jgi:hypothetical protein
MRPDDAPEATKASLESIDLAVDELVDRADGDAGPRNNEVSALLMERWALERLFGSEGPSDEKLLKIYAEIVRDSVQARLDAKSTHHISLTREIKKVRDTLSIIMQISVALLGIATGAIITHWLNG